jgi:hypothetical protein
MMDPERLKTVRDEAHALVHAITSAIEHAKPYDVSESGRDLDDPKTEIGYRIPMRTYQDLAHTTQALQFSLIHLAASLSNNSIRKLAFLEVVE